MGGRSSEIIELSKTGMSLRAIARVLGEPQGTVMSTMREYRYPGSRFAEQEAKKARWSIEGLPNSRQAGAFRRRAPWRPRAVEPDMSRAIPIEQIDGGTCKWPLWDGDTKIEDRVYCGHQVGIGSYCPGHASIAFRR